MEKNHELVCENEKGDTEKTAQTTIPAHWGLTIEPESAEYSGDSLGRLWLLQRFDRKASQSARDHNRISVYPSTM